MDRAHHDTCHIAWHSFPYDLHHTTDRSISPSFTTQTPEHPIPHSHIRSYIRKVQSGLFDSVRAMSNAHIPFSNRTTDHHLALPPLSARYRAECTKDLALLRAILCHPTIGRRHSPGALDHAFSLPDGHGVTVRASRLTIPRALVDQLANDYAEFYLLRDQPIYMYSLAVKVESASEVVLRGLGGTNHTRAHNRRRARAVVEALHHPEDADKIYENGSDPSLPGRRFSWLATRDARPLPCPEELFSPRTSVA